MIAHAHLVVCLIAGVQLTYAQHEVFGDTQEGGVYDGGSMHPPPQPYSFSYTSQDAEGGHARREQGDGSGRVRGEYSINLADGRSRTVRYMADELGYRAQIVTNELGTESKSPSDVFLESHAPTGEQAAYATRMSSLDGHPQNSPASYRGTGGDALGPTITHGLIARRSRRKKA